MPKITEERRQYQRAYYEKNREELLKKQRVRNKRHYAEKPELYRAKTKAWKEANPQRYRELSQAHRDANREQYRARSRDWYHSNKDRASAKGRKAKLARYGLTEEAYQAMLEQQDQSCAICREPNNLDRRMYVDHCHATGKVRGLLCQKCNAAIGMLKDSPTLLQRAMDYLRSNGSSGATSTTSSEPLSAP